VHLRRGLPVPVRPGAGVILHGGSVDRVRAPSGYAVAFRVATCGACRDALAERG
jgi:hypothetical protein